MKKMLELLYRVSPAVILAGVFLLFMGLYYAAVKAGIPYQDPPLELQIRYELNARIGEILVGNGLRIALGGGVIRLLLHWIRKKK